MSRVNGQATFSLYNVRKDDEGLYCCLVSPGSPDFEQMTDFVQLVVVGMYLFRELSFTREDTSDSRARARNSSPFSSASSSAVGLSNWTGSALLFSSLALLPANEDT